MERDPPASVGSLFAVEDTTEYQSCRAFSTDPKSLGGERKRNLHIASRVHLCSPKKEKRPDPRLSGSGRVASHAQYYL